MYFFLKLNIPKLGAKKMNKTLLTIAISAALMSSTVIVNTAYAEDIIDSNVTTTDVINT